MKTKYLFALATCLLATGFTAQATTNLDDIVVPQRSELKQAKEVVQMAKLPAAVRSFLKSDAGKNFTAADFLSYREDVTTTTLRNKQASEAPDPEEILVFSEDFSLWTAGSDGAYDAADIATDSVAFQTYMHTPGWQGLFVYQAGGMAYLGYDEEDGPGYLMTPEIDLASTGGIYKLKFRARSANPLHQKQALQTWSMKASGGIINAQAYTITDAWTDCEIQLSGGESNTRVMFHGMQGMVYVDDFEVIALDYGIAKPSIEKVELQEVDKIAVEWTKVDAATSYRVALYNIDADKYEIEEFDTQSTNTVYVFDFAPVPCTYYRIEVKACDAEHVSPAAMSPGYISPDALDAPVALPATDVTESGFTANWEAVSKAYAYKVNLSLTQTAEEDSTEVVIIDETFDGMPAATADGPVNVALMSSLDGYFNCNGWISDIGFGDTSMFGFCNMYAAEGLPGLLMSPEYDLSTGGGTVEIYLKTKSYFDDATIAVMFVNVETQEIIAGGGLVAANATEWSEYKFELKDGTARCQIYFMFYDAGEIEIVWLDDLKITKKINKDETFRMPYKTIVTEDYTMTSCYVETPNKPVGVNYSYNVVAHYPGDVENFIDEVNSESSNEIEVNYSQSVEAIEADALGRAFVSGDVLYVINPGNAPVAVYTVSGVLVAQDNTGSATISCTLADKGVYIVRIGNKAVKVIK